MSLCWTDLHGNEGMQWKLGCASKLERDPDNFFIFSKRISQFFPMGYSKCMGKDESLFRRMWDVIYSIFNPSGETGLGCLWCPKGIVTATGSLGATAGPAPTPHVEQLWERFLRSLGHLAQLSEGLSCWISWSGMGEKLFPRLDAQAVSQPALWYLGEDIVGKMDAPDHFYLILWDSWNIISHIPWAVCLLLLFANRLHPEWTIREKEESCNKVSWLNSPSTAMILFSSCSMQPHGAEGAGVQTCEGPRAFWPLQGALHPAPLPAGPRAGSTGSREDHIEPGERSQRRHPLLLHRAGVSSAEPCSRAAPPSPWKSWILMVGFVSITPCLKRHLSVCDITEAQFEIVFKFLYRVHSGGSKTGRKHVGCFFL